MDDKTNKVNANILVVVTKVKGFTFQLGVSSVINCTLQIPQNAAPPTRSTPYGATAGQASYDILGGKATRLLVKNNHAEEKLSCPESNSVVCF